MKGLHGKPDIQGGFSLLELLVTLTVAATLLLIAVRNFRDAIHRNQVSSASNALLAGLAYARTEAINRSQLVSMCPSSDGASCTTGGQAFESGWIIYTYPAGTASANKAYSAGLIKLQALGARAGVSIQSKGATVITFGQQGQLDPNTQLTFATCYRDSATGPGASTNAVPGAELDVRASGGVTTKAWTVGAACTPT